MQEWVLSWLPVILAQMVSIFAPTYVTHQQRARDGWSFTLHWVGQLLEVGRELRLSWWAEHCLCLDSSREQTNTRTDITHQCCYFSLWLTTAVWTRLASLLYLYIYLSIECSLFELTSIRVRDDVGGKFDKHSKLTNARRLSHQINITSRRIPREENSQSKSESLSQTASTIVLRSLIEIYIR